VAADANVWVSATGIFVRSGFGGVHRAGKSK
jgi:hypothetical protein